MDGLEGKLQTANSIICQVNATIDNLQLQLEQKDSDNVDLQRNLCISKTTVAELEDKIKSLNFLKKWETDNEAVKFFTGLSSYAKLLVTFNYVVKFLQEPKRGYKLSYFEQFCMTLMRLRLNLKIQDLAYRFDVSKSSASTYIDFWLHAMYTVLVPTCIFWPARENLRCTMPLCFREKFRKCSVIIDCFEIFLERPIQIKGRASTYSNYKSHNTVKYLIGIAPQGCITFISLGYGGRTCDKKIVEDSGFLEHLVVGDVVLADRGFTVHEVVNMQGANLQIPAFKGTRSQLRQIEVEESRDLSRVRIHVERVIGAVKQRYSILQGPLDTYSLLSDETCTSVVDKMVRVSCALYNICESVVPLI